MKVTDEMYNAGMDYLRRKGTAWCVNDLFIIMFNKLRSPVLIEDGSDSSWGVSFDGHNPDCQNFVKCASRDDAVKLMDLIT